MCKTMTELNKVVADYRSLKAMEEELKNQIKAAEQEIISYLEANGKDAEVGNDYKIKYSSCTRKTLDNKRLEADLGSLEEYYKVTTYSRLSVK